MREPGPCVLHVANLNDQEALETLSRTTRVIEALGVAQIMLALDSGRRADSFALPADNIRRLQYEGLSVLGKVRALQSEFSRLDRENAVWAVHLHGMGPCWLGARALSGSALRPRVLYSPHWRHFRLPWMAALLGRLVQTQLPAFRYALVAASWAEAEALSKLLNRSAEVLPRHIGEAFFAARRQEGDRPSILAYGPADEAVDVVTRLSVLLNGRDARIRFSWLGAAGNKGRAQLAAAGVQVLDVARDGGRAQVLSQATAFLHLSMCNDEPLALMQAMAAGVPCLVSDVPQHRALIRHGETGFICTSERDLLEMLVLLLRDRTERKRVGEAARAEAGRRFTLRHLERAVLRAYGFSRSGLPGSAFSSSGFARGDLLRPSAPRATAPASSSVAL